MKTKNMTAIILAGGKSSRMGRDKSLVEFGGEPLLARAVRVLNELFGEVVVVTNQDVPFELNGARVVRDEVPHQGPLRGISAGLKASSHENNFVIAVDMPFISADSITYLAGFTGEADVVVPRTANGLEPLFAFYNKRSLPAIEEALAQGERKIISMFPQVNVRTVEQDEMVGLKGADTTFLNVNTERDLKDAHAQMQGTFLERTPVERPVTIYVNSEELVTVQTSLEHLDELACGFLFAEGVLQERDALLDIRINEERGEVRVRTKKSTTNASKSMGKRFVTSGCGKGFSFVSLGDALNIAKNKSQFTIPAKDIPEFMKQFLRSSRRAGMHSSGLIKDGEIVFTRQDIGRHNTVDMIVGRLWLDGAEDRDVLLFTTGRISYEMVVKAAKAGIPILVSRTAATDMAADLAKRLGIEVIGYVRGANMKVY
ncbi:formate dehydrogenase accessory sulfurtransferase FdhD, partial [Candidatus Aquicultor sp.]